MQTWTYVSFVGVLLMKWIYGLAAADDLESLCATADTPYLQALCAEDAAPKKIHRTARALSEDYFLRFGKGDPLFESKRFMRFGRNYGGSLDDALEIALKKVQDLERNTGIKLRRRRSADAPSENEEAHPENEDSRVKRDSSNAETNTPDEKDSALVDKRFMRFGRGGDEIDKRFMRFGRSGEMDKRFMRFGRAEKRFMRFGRDPGMYDEFEDNIPEKRFMRFGKRFMRFGRSGDIDEDDDTFEPEDKRFMRFGKRFMRFGRSGGDLDKRFMRFGRSGADMDKRFMRFGRSDNSPDKRFMRFGRSDGSVDKRFMRFGKREAPNQTEES